jgi:hypothetical protein
LRTKSERQHSAQEKQPPSTRPQFPAPASRRGSASPPDKKQAEPDHAQEDHQRGPPGTVFFPDLQDQGKDRDDQRGSATGDLLQILCLIVLLATPIPIW